MYNIYIFAYASCPLQMTELDPVSSLRHSPLRFAPWPTPQCGRVNIAIGDKSVRAHAVRSTTNPKRNRENTRIYIYLGVKLLVANVLLVPDLILVTDKLVNIITRSHIRVTV